MPGPTTAVLIPTTCGRAHGQRATGVARVQGGIGLDDVVDQPGGGARRGHERPAEGAHHAGADRAGEPEGVADGHHQLPDAQGVGVAELRRHVPVPGGAHDGQVREAVGADHLERDLLPEENVAVPPRPPSTTWAEVTSRPSPERTTAEPDPAGALRPSPPRTRRLATDGTRRSATSTTARE